MNKLKLLANLLKGNNFWSIFYNYFLGLFLEKRLSRFKIKGCYVWVRLGTTDLEAAISCLEEEEFESLSNAYDRDHSGLIIDAGAYIGTASIAFSKMYPNSTILALEPSRENFKLLQKNVAQYANIKPLNFALVANENAGTVELKDGGTGQWSLTLVEPQNKKFRKLETVNTTNINSLLNEYNASKIMILKLDIEGSEDELFKKPAWMDKTDIISVELHEGNAPGVTQNFFNTNLSRFVYKQGGEKYFSVGKSFFQEKN